MFKSLVGAALALGLVASPALAANANSPYAISSPLPFPSGLTFPTLASDGTNTSLQTIVNAVGVDAVADLTAGLAVFTALNDTAGAACYQQLLTSLTAIQKATAANTLPKVHVAYDLSVARSLVLAVQPNSPIMNACSPVATQTGQSVVNIVNGIVGGVALKAVIPAL